MGVGILIPMDSPIGMLFGLFAILLIIFFIIIIIGSIFSNILSGIVGVIGSINDEKDLWYHKKDKSNGIAFICSLLLPFSGNLYLKENIFNLVTTLISIFILLITMWGLLSIPDFYYQNNYVITILIALWVISLISLGINIKQYNKYKKYYSPDKKTSLESISGNKLFIAIPIILLILFLSVNFMVMNDTSDKLYETNLYSVEYPYNYALGEDNGDEYWIAYGGPYKNTRFDKIDSENSVSISYIDYEPSLNEAFNGLHVAEYNDGSKHVYGEDGGTVKIDGKKARILEDDAGGWTKVLFKNNDKLYIINFGKETQKDMDFFINSFKFK